MKFRVKLYFEVERNPKIENKKQISLTVFSCSYVEIFVYSVATQVSSWQRSKRKIVERNKKAVFIVILLQQKIILTCMKYPLDIHSAHIYFVFIFCFYLLFFALFWCADANIS